MDNIRVKEDSLNNWRAGFEIEEGKKKVLTVKHVGMDTSLLELKRKVVRLLIIV